MKCSLFKNALFWMIFTAIFCFLINILINLLISKIWYYLTDKFLPTSLLFLQYLIILILFFYNYFLLRYIVISWIFDWQYPFQFFSIYKERQSYLSYLKSIINDFIHAIDILISDYNSLAKIEFEFFDSFFYLFDEEYNIYHDLYTIINSKPNNNNGLIKYKMSKCQIKYYNLLNNINNILNSNNLKNILLTNSKHNDKDIISNKINDNVDDIANIIRQLKVLLNEYQDIINKYDRNNYTYMSPSYLFNLFFNDTFGSLSLYTLQFRKHFEKCQVDSDFTPKGKIHYTLIRKDKNNTDNNNIDDNNIISKNNNDDGTLMIFCLPNAAIFEVIAKEKIDFYLNNGFSFLCWNYNGYGYSKGSPNFNNFKQNVLELYDIMVQNPKYNFRKICVYGYSIGGLPAIFLAKNRHVDLLISDRNFCDLNRTVNNFHFGTILNFLLKYMFIGNTENIENFFDFNLKKTYKIIIYSPIDTLLLNDASLKSGVARYIIKNYIVYKNNGNINNVIKDKENFLDIVFDKNEKQRFLNDFLEISHLYYDNKDDYYDYYYYGENYNYENNEGNIGDIDTNINIIDNGNINQNEILDKFFNSFFGCCDELNIIIKMRVSRRREKIYIDNFFNNLLIWGIQKPNEKECLEFHSHKGQKSLKDAYKLLNEYINGKNQLNDSKISILLAKIKDQFNKIINVIDNLDISLNVNINLNNINIIEDNKEIKEKLISNDNDNEIRTNINSYNSEINKDLKFNNGNQFYNKLNNIIGNIKLLKTYAGHNGWLSEEEKEQFNIFLLFSGITD